MINPEKSVVLSGLGSLFHNNYDLTEILLQRVIYRINRVIKPVSVIILEDINRISTKNRDLLKQLTCPVSIYSSNHELEERVPEELSIPSFIIEPYSYLILSENSPRIENLAMDRTLQLEDNHIHTPLAYCNYNMEMDKAIYLAGIFGLSCIRVTEHSSHLYYTDEIFKNSYSYVHGISTARAEDSRVELYLDLKERYQSDSVKFGLEVDCDFNGNFLLREEDKSGFEFILGAIHRLDDVTENGFLTLLENILKNGIDVLAHPFRIFRKSGVEVPRGIYRKTAELLKKYNTAAEINYHTNEPSIDFIRECLKIGVKFSFGSDSHNLAEIGDFYYQLHLLEEAGFKGCLDEILWKQKKAPTTGSSDY